MAAIRDLILNLQERKEGNALTSAANDLEKLSRGVDASGHAMHDMESDAKRLNAEIEKSTVRIKDLHTQVAKTGDVSLFGDIRREEARLRNFEKTLAALVPEAEKIGGQIGDELVKGVGSSFSGAASTPVLGPALIAALVGALAVATPILFTLLGGAIAGAVGTIGVAGGILAAVKDPAVHSALDHFVDDAKQQFFSIGANFIQPVREGLGILDRALLNSHLDKVFAPAAQDVTIIADGIARMVQNFLPGFQRALERSAPFAAAAANGLAGFGEALGYAVDQISQSKGALEGLKSLFLLLNGTIIGLTNTITFLGGVYDWLADKAATLFDGLAKASDFFGKHGQAQDFRDMANVLHNLGNEAIGATTATKGFNGALDYESINAENARKHIAALSDETTRYEQLALGVWSTNIQVAQGFQGLADAVAQGTRGFDVNTVAGAKNQAMIEQQIALLIKQRDDAIKAGDGSIESANKQIKAYDDQLAAVLKYAQQLGATRAQLEAIAKTYYATLIVDIQQRNQINKASAIDRALGNLMGFASGGTVPGPIGKPRLAVVHGGERVLTPGEAASTDQGSEPRQFVFSFEAPPAGSGLEELWRVLRKYIRVNGGDVQTVLGV